MFSEEKKKKKLSGALKEKQGSEMKRQEEMLVQAKRMCSSEGKSFSFFFILCTKHYDFFAHFYISFTAMKSISFYRKKMEVKMFRTLN